MSKLIGGEDDKTMVQTYVYHGDKAFFVSTIERDSSACVEAPPPRFSETIVWSWDPKTRERGDIIFMDGGSRYSIREHQECVERIFRTGSPEKTEYEPRPPTSCARPNRHRK